MKTKTFQVLARVSFCVLGSVSLAAMPVAADGVDDVLKIGQAKVAAAQKSQEKIDEIADQTDALLQDYKQVNKQIEGLRVYNAQLEARIQDQLRRIAEIDQAMKDVTVIQRQITPLVEEMLNGLEQFIELDVPFHIDERRDRVSQLRGNLDASNQTAAELFRQVLEAYKIENEYGRKIDAYEAQIDISGDGQEQKVDVFRVGRIALLYKTPDGEQVGRWNNKSRSWESLDASAWSSNLQQGIRIARNQAVKDILQLPIEAPEAAQ